MTRDSGPRTGRRKRGLGRFLFKYLPGWFAVLVAIAGLVLGGYSGYQARPYVAPQPTVTVTVTAGPTADSTAEGPPSCSPASSTFTALVPKKQNGWTGTWHGCQTIDSAGIVFTDDRPRRADGSDYSVAYQAGNGGWLTADRVYEFVRWPSGKTTPGPAYCSAELTADRVDAEATRAEPGRAYCYLEYPGGARGRIAFLQVYAVSGDTVTADVWVWRQKP